MKNIILALLLLTVSSINSFADTVDFYQLYYNDSLYYSHEATGDRDPTIFFPSGARSTDTFTFRYFRDTPSPSALSEILITTLNGDTVLYQKETGIYVPFKVSLPGIYPFSGQKNPEKKPPFVFFYRDNEYGPGAFSKLFVIDFRNP